MKIWKTLGYLDMDHDGDVDSVDAMIYDDCIEEGKKQVSCDYLDDDDEDDFDEFEDSDDNDEDDYGDYLYTPPKPIVEGPMKYFNGEWNFFLALIDKFPELKKDYSGDENLSLGDFFVEMSEVSPSKTVKYWKWLMDTFTSQMLKETNGTTGESFSNEPGGYILGHTWYWGDKESGTALLNVIKEEKYFKYVFEDTIWEKHDTITIDNILELAYEKKQFDLLKKIFNAYREHQKTQYTNRDISEIWRGFLINVDKPLKPEIEEYIKEIANSIGEFGKRIIKQL